MARKPTVTIDATPGALLSSDEAWRSVVERGTGVWAWDVASDFVSWGPFAWLVTCAPGPWKLLWHHCSHPCSSSPVRH